MQTLHAKRGSISFRWSSSREEETYLLEEWFLNLENLNSRKFQWWTSSLSFVWLEAHIEFEWLKLICYIVSEGRIECCNGKESVNSADWEKEPRCAVYWKEFWSSRQSGWVRNPRKSKGAITENALDKKNQINHMLDLLSSGHAVTVGSDYLPKIVERPSH